MICKAHDFVDTKNLEYYYGIKVKHNNKWVIAGDDNGRFIFKEKNERDLKMKELKEKTL